MPVRETAELERTLTADCTHSGGRVDSGMIFQTQNLRMKTTSVTMARMPVSVQAIETVTTL